MVSWFDVNNFVPDLGVEGASLFEMVQHFTLQKFILYPIVLLFVGLNLVLFFVGLSRTSVRKGKVIRSKFFMGTGLWWLIFLLFNMVFLGVVVLTLFFPVYTKLLIGG